MSNLEADFITILSSDMIGEIVEEYMNKRMYKKKVKVVDLKPTESGYMFSLAYTIQEEVKPKTEYVDTKMISRNRNGQFKKKEKVNE